MVIGALALALAAAPAGAAAREDSDPARFVDPFVGTARGAPGFATGGGAGATFPGAVVPFGMVQLSPDTSPGTDNFAGGYSYRDRRLRGFGLTHFSGAGCAVFQDVPILPTPLRLTGSPVDAGSSDLDERYLPAFAHNREWASPGSYRVILSPGTRRRVAVDLTATTRTGAARFQFPATRTATVLFNAGGSAKANGEAAVRIDPARREVDGMAESGRFCHQADSYRVYFAARFDRPFRAYGTWRRQALRPRSRRSSDRSSVPIRLARVPVPASVARARDSRGTAQAGAYATFDAGRRRTVEVRIGVSFTSVAEARRNLRAEASWRSFGALRARARASWNAALRRLTVAGGSRTNLRLFYTALYHALLHPNVVGDADGAYRGMDGRRHRDRGRVAYANVSG